VNVIDNMSGSVWLILLYGQIISSWQGTALLWSLSDLSRPSQFLGRI